jgi:hypothetical protein
VKPNQPTRRGGPSWTRFLRAHAAGTIATGCLTVEVLTHLDQQVTGLLADPADGRVGGHAGRPHPAPVEFDHEQPAASSWRCCRCISTDPGSVHPCLT